ncbi:MAG: PQQ-dependent sugar dehydrogenase [Vicinamibacterales bacterium]
MPTSLPRVLAATLLIAMPALLHAAQSAQLAQVGDPFPQPVVTGEGVIRVNLVEFAVLPAVDGQPARMMLMSHEPGTRRLFVNDMRGPLYSVSYDGKTVALYLDINAANWGVPVQSMGNERGFQSFAFHPQFDQAGSRGYGKFYTYLDTSNMAPQADFHPGGDTTTHHTVLLEWTAKNAAAATYDGGPPRELMRFRQPFPNHNAGLVAFNPLATQGHPDYGLLYMGVADGGSGGDPFRHAQSLGNAFGKIFRIDPLGNNSLNKKYGIPLTNVFASDNNPQTLGEIYAYGVRNPQRFGWDSKNGNLFVADIGQNIVEEISLVRPAANLGWNDWEASFRFVSRTEIKLDGTRADAKVTYPLVEYDHNDALFPTGRAAITGLVVYRGAQIPQLANMVLFGDNPSGEVFYFSADTLPEGGQDPIRRVMFGGAGAAKTLLQLIREKKPNAPRVDLRFGTGPNEQVFLLNKQDNAIRQLVR